MGFCDVCGAREDNPYAPRNFDLSKTKMKKYAEGFYYFTICHNCYKKIERFDNGDKKVFKDFNFAKIEIEKLFRSEKAIQKHFNKNQEEFRAIEKRARQRCYEAHQMDDECQKCSNKLTCIRENKRLEK